MRKIVLTFVLLSAACGGLHAQENLQQILPLLQKQEKTAAEVANITNVFFNSREANLTFASGAALVQSPPVKENTARFLNLIISSQDGLKKIFSSVILVAMDQKYVELIALLDDAAHSDDPMIKAYTATAVVVLDPSRTEYAEEVFALYPFSKNFAMKALNQMYKDNSRLIAGARKTAAAQNPFARAGAAEALGDFGAEKEQAFLFKMLKKEESTISTSAIARAIARHPASAVDGAKKCLTAPSSSAYAYGCTLTIGFMTDKGISVIKDGLTSKKPNERANAVRAAAVMANVLSGESGAVFSTDLSFDKRSLKELIPAVAKMSQDDTDTTVRAQAESALKEFSKILN